MVRDIFGAEDWGAHCSPCCRGNRHRLNDLLGINDYDSISNRVVAPKATPLTKVACFNHRSIIVTFNLSFAREKETKHSGL